MRDDPYGSFGLDISDAYIRAVRLDARDAVRSYGEAALPKGVIRRGRIQDAAALCVAVRQLLASVRGEPLPKRIWAFVALPNSCVIIRQFDFPSGTRGRKLRKLIRARFEEEYPLMDEEKYVSWETVEPAKPHEPIVALAALASKRVVDEYAARLGACGLRIAGMQAESIAAANALVPGGLAGGDPQARGVMDGTVFVDCRDGYATLTFFDLGSVQFVLTVEGQAYPYDGLLHRVCERLALGADWYERNKGGIFSKVALVGEAKTVESLVRDLGKGGRFTVVLGDHYVNLAADPSGIRLPSDYAAAIGLALRTEL